MSAPGAALPRIRRPLTVLPEKDDPPRTRTWNLRLRRPTPYPLGQRADKEMIPQVGLDSETKPGFSRLSSGPCPLHFWAGAVVNASRASALDWLGCCVAVCGHINTCLVYTQMVECTLRLLGYLELPRHSCAVFN